MFSTSASSAASTPIRRQSSAIQHIPFSTNLSHLSAELGKTDSAASSPCRSDVSFGGLSFRGQEQQKKSLEEENFKLKLRVYMLEERLQRQDSNEASNKALADLKVQSAALREELTQKSLLLRRASDTLEALERRQSEQQARLRQDQAERALLEDTLQELEAQYRAETEQREAAEAKRSRLETAVHGEQRQTAAALAGMRQSLAEERRRRERADRERGRAEQERERAEKDRSRAEQERGRIQEELNSLQLQHGEETRRCERLTAENDRLEELVSRWRQQPDTQTEEPEPTPAGSGGGPATALLQRQLAAAAGERRREQAVAAAALQLQTERARSLQASVQSLSEQLRRGQAELSQSRAELSQSRAELSQSRTELTRTQTELTQTRAERDRLLQLHRLQRESSDSEALLSSTEGVEVIPEPVETSRDDLLHSCDSPGPDLAAWLGSMPRLRSDSLEEALGPPQQDTSPADSPAASQTHEATEPAEPRDVPCTSLVTGPPTGDTSDWDTWSEPDRSVSRARIGLERSSLEPPAEVTTDTDNKPGRRSHRQASADVRDLDGRLEGLRAVRDGLWAEVAICQKLVTAANGTPEQQSVPMPPGLLEDVERLHHRLEEAVLVADRLGGRPETDRWSTPPPELTLALTITQEELAETAQKLSAAQQRVQRLRTRLQQTRDRLRQAEQDNQQLQQERDAAAQQISRLTERLEQTEAERARLAEAARRQSERQDGGQLRRLRLQLERSSQRQQELEQLVGRLSGQLRQLPAGDAEQRVWQAEQQLLTLGRRRLRLQADITRLRSRARFLHSQERVHQSQQAEAEAATTFQPTWHQQEQQQEQQEQQQEQWMEYQQRRRWRRSSSTGGAEESRAVREERRAVIDLTDQLERARAEIERMRAGAHHYDEAGHSCPESARSCDLPLTPSSPDGDGPRRSSHSESDPLEPLRVSCGQPVYSSPDLGIESDCQRCSSRTSGTTVRAQRSAAADATQRPSGGEATPVAAGMDLCPLAATRSALQEALRRLDRAEHGRAAVQGAIYRGSGQTQLTVTRARGGPRRQAAGAAGPTER